MDKALEAQTILNGSKVKNPNEVHDRYTPEYRRVARVASRAIDAAKVLCEVKIADAKSQLEALHRLESGKLPLSTQSGQGKSAETGVRHLLQMMGPGKAEAHPPATSSSASPSSSHYSEIIQLEYELERWNTALEHLTGDWRFIVIKDKDTANAFVSSNCPKRIFVLEGFFNALNPTDDELGLVLSHELSHLMLDHTSHQALSS